MGGRGAKVSLKTAPAPTPQTQQPIFQQAPSPSNTNVTQNAAQVISSMTDAQLAQAVRDARALNSNDMPNYLADASDITQRFVFVTGLNEKPMVLDSQAFQNFIQSNNMDKADILSRSVSSAKYRNQQNTKVNISSDMIFNMLMNSRFNYIGGKQGGQAYGAGTYLARQFSGNTGYGGTTKRAVLNPNTAKPISKQALTQLASQMATTHPQLTRALGPISWGANGNASIYALAAGYNVITEYNSGIGKNASNRSSGEYINVIDRKALVWEG